MTFCQLDVALLLLFYWYRSLLLDSGKGTSRNGYGYLNPTMRVRYVRWVLWGANSMWEVGD